MLDKVLLKGDVLEALRRSPPARGDLRLLLEVAFPADIAELLLDLSPEEQVLVLRSLDRESAAEVLSEAEERVQKDLLLNLLTRTEITGILSEIAPDDGADLVGLLPEHEGAQALEHVEPEQADAIRALAGHHPETAGGIMTTEFLSVGPELTVEDALETVRQSVDVEAISNVYVTERDGTLVGVISVRDILEEDPEARVAEVMTEEVITAAVDADQEDASRLLDRYDFSSLPVVDEGHRLLGVITVDDAMDVLEEEAEEDLALLSGSGQISARDSVVRNLKLRLPWLLITLGGGLSIVVLLSHFQRTLAECTALAFFMPVMAGMAGNVGIQSSTVMVRGFATGEMVLGMTIATVGRQLLVGLSLGSMCGLVTGVLARVLFSSGALGLAIGVSMIVGVTSAAAVGTLLPIVCQRVRVDPAVAAGPFVTTLNDLFSLLIYFSVATLLLLRTT